MNDKILHDLRRIANAMRMIFLETAGDEKLKEKILLLSQHLDKLYDDLNKEEGMDFKKMFQKGGLALLTFVVSYLVSHPQAVLKLVPEDITQMTVGSLIAAILVAANNYLKHRKDKK